ncbi:peptidylprolyl isomerase [Pontibacter liquoris]|uniref:peptidylprolyl isomerase n=1 Tax=Pontibacter liquoris TaxID=2905677 RepID=UPI001FA6FEF4|nr:peptidylprolyl isomerase [Pontibacter liquoris]
MKRTRAFAAICHPILVVACLVSLASCNQDNKAAQQQRETPPPVAEEPTLKSLTPETAVPVLTEFAKNNPDSLFLIRTRLGDIKVRLYKDTPLHRANFVRLAKAGFYDEGEFYRVVKGFAIQGGDSDERKMKLGAYKIPQEINLKNLHIHKKGALAMARYGDERNPEKESSSHNFYIVQGKPRSVSELRAIEAQHHMQYTPEQIRIYKTLGGEPGLDTEYTVFGEVVEGLDVVDKIANVQVGGGDWPVDVVKHQIKVVEN